MTDDEPRVPGDAAVPPSGTHHLLWSTRARLLADATVLVVDDDEVKLGLLLRLLRQAGVATVHGLTDPRQATARCLELRPDLLILDLHMPHLDGFGVLEELQAALRPETFMPILVVTGDATTEARNRVLGAGAKDFLTTPFDPAEVLLRVSNLLETRALYGRLELDNTELQAALDQQLAEERRLRAEHQECMERVLDVLREDRLTMVFQPVVDLGTGDVVGVEALARFATDTPRPPNLWFADALQVGLAGELELRAVSRAFDQLASLPPDLFVAINLSPAVVMTEGIESVFAHADGRRVVLELTEHTRIDDYDGLLAALDGLRLQGVRVAVDDAGAGYAGLHHILRILPDVIKMDIELITGIDEDPVRRALASALVAFAKEIGAVIVAEGIETAAELEVLRRLRVGWGQGYYLGRPGALPLPFTRVDSIGPAGNL